VGGSASYGTPHLTPPNAGYGAERCLFADMIFTLIPWRVGRLQSGFSGKRPRRGQRPSNLINFIITNISRKEQPVKIGFYGAAQQVTGSCYLLEENGLRILVDCGLYQERDFLSRNWEPFPFSPQTIDYLLLSHVHIDHGGLIPKLVREGFRGNILATLPSQDMLPIVLLDSARIHEEDAAYKKKRHKKEGRRGPHPEIPLYTVEDAEKSLDQVESIPYNSKTELNRNVSVCFHDAGHILGSAMLEIKWNTNGSERTILFSGDMGQNDKPLIKDPTMFERADYVVMETTYGDRVHEDPADVEEMLCRFINETIEAGGNILIPTFAIERAQELLYHLSLLSRQDRIPYLMMFLDSPMAVNITDVFRRNLSVMDKETKELFRDGKSPFQFPGLRLVRAVEESKAINTIKGSCIVMAGSGMCTGGRIKHHLVKNISRPESTLLFVGYQAKGTLGRLLIEGKNPVRILGKNHDVRARIEQIHGFSAHADKLGLMRWVTHLKNEPRRIFLTHGEREGAFSFAEEIKRTKNWKTHVPEYMEEVDLG